MQKGIDKKCRLFTLEEFDSFVNSLYEEDVYVEASLDGLYIGLNEEDLPAEDLHDRIAKALDVGEVTSIHIDDYEPCCVWVTYKDKELPLLKEITAFDKVELNLENWSTVNTTGVIGYYRNVKVASAPVFNLEDFEKFIDDHKRYLSVSTRLIVSVDTEDLTPSEFIEDFVFKARKLFKSAALKSSVDKAFAPEEDLLRRYSAAIKKIGTPNLLDLPEDDKKRLRENKDLEYKTVILEEIAKRFEKERSLKAGKNQKSTSVCCIEWDTDREYEDLPDFAYWPYYVPENEIAATLTKEYGIPVKSFSMMD